jgi:hypothetical protein
VLSSEDDSLIERVRRNYRILDTCFRHDFSIDLRPDTMVGKRWKCANCSGEVDSIRKDWYEMGLHHGQKEKDS